MGEPINSYRHDPLQCPRCERSLDGSMNTKPGGGGPGPDDLTVCAYCAAVLRYGAGLRLREVPIDELRREEHETRLAVSYTVSMVLQAGCDRE